MEEKKNTKVEVVKAFIKSNPKKIAAVILVLLSALPPESQELIKAVIEALVQSAG